MQQQPDIYQTLLGFIAVIFSVCIVGIITLVIVHLRTRPPKKEDWPKAAPPSPKGVVRRKIETL